MEYEIKGTVMPMLEIQLTGGEAVYTESGGMAWMSEGIDMKTSGRGGLGKMLGRALSGESLFLTHFTNVGHGKREVSFAAPYPGKIVPVDLATMNQELICQKDAFLCASKGTEVSIELNRRLGAGFFGGEGFSLQRLRGDGMAFLHAGGTVVERELNNETLLIDTGCIVAFTRGLNYSIERAGNLKSMVFGGEGLFLATMQGVGKVYLQTLPFSRLADRILKHAPKAGGSAKGEGSVLGGVGRLLDGV